MTTNTQPQTQQSGGDELEQMLKAFQHDVAATGYPMNSPGQDDLLTGATKALKQYIQVWERTARIEQCQRLRKLRDETGEEYYNLLIAEEIRLGEPRAGEGGEV